MKVVKFWTKRSDTDLKLDRLSYIICNCCLPLLFGNRPFDDLRKSAIHNICILYYLLPFAQFFQVLQFLGVDVVEKRSVFVQCLAQVAVQDVQSVLVLLLQQIVQLLMVLFSDELLDNLPVALTPSDRVESLAPGSSCPL